MVGVDALEEGLEDSGEEALSARATPLLKSSGKLILKFILVLRAGVEMGVALVGVIGADGGALLLALALPFPLKLE